MILFLTSFWHVDIKIETILAHVLQKGLFLLHDVAFPKWRILCWLMNLLGAYWSEFCRVPCPLPARAGCMRGPEPPWSYGWSGVGDPKVLVNRYKVRRG